MAGVISDPMPSPSIKGIIGLSGTISFPEESIDIFEPVLGSLMCSNSMIALYN